MKTRTLLSAALIAAVVGLFFIDGYFLEPYRPLVCLLIAAAGAAGWLEFSSMAGLGDPAKGGQPFFTRVGFAALLYFYAAAWWTGCPALRAAAGGEGPSGGALAFRATFEQAAVMGLFVLALLAFTYTVFQKDYLQYYRKAFESIVGALFLGCFPAYMIRIYLLPERRGIWLGLILFAGIKGTDIVAYCVGKAIGRTHCVPVSPKKTLAGCVAGLAWGGLWFGGAAWAWESILFPWPQGIVFGIILSLVAQIGDFTESLIKREYQMKDSQNLLPEFGGVLDMIDSLLFSGYLFWCLI